MPMTTLPPDTYDAPWKQALELYIEAFLAFFFPAVHAAVDWTHPVEFLDQELQKIVRYAEQGVAHVDKLVKVRLKDGTSYWLFIHIEVQSQYDATFLKRMWVYYYRLYDRYGEAVVSLAVLGDEHPGWRPNDLRWERLGLQVQFTFPIVKLQDYRQQWALLETSHNPFATVVMAHLKTQETRHQVEDRKRWKLALARRLYQRQYTRQEVLNLLHFLDWMMYLPEDLDRAFWDEVKTFEEEQEMQHITFLEREALTRGSAEGFTRGSAEGFVRGQRQELLDNLALMLDLKFGEAGATLLPDLQQITDVALLRAVRNAIKSATTLDDLRAIYCAPTQSEEQKKPEPDLPALPPDTHN
ncbi:MAG: cytosolic protein [Chloroflexaceae bacterium]|nr:cytosolic protein [Chloroflexaceae bacterium]